MQLSRTCSGVRGLFSISMCGKKYDLLTTLLGILAGGVCGGGKGNMIFFCLCKAVYPTGVPERPLLGKVEQGKKPKKACSGGCQIGRLVRSFLSRVVLYKRIMRCHPVV